MSTTASAFSSSDTAALEREADVTDEVEVTLQEIWNEKQSKHCLEWICKNGYKRVINAIVFDDKSYYLIIKCLLLGLLTISG